MKKIVKRRKNEQMGNDLYADLYQWFNKYCINILNKDPYMDRDDLLYELNDADMSDLVDDAVSALEADFGWDLESLEEREDDIELEIENLLDEVENKVDDWMPRAKNGWSKNNTDWLDKYNDHDAYSASFKEPTLADYADADARRESFNRSKLREKKLEARISRLEKLLRERV